jgi:hypothetical protein
MLFIPHASPLRQLPGSLIFQTWEGAKKARSGAGNYSIQVYGMFIFYIALNLAAAVDIRLISPAKACYIIRITGLFSDAQNMPEKK